jgi:TPR repeat protein
MKYAWPFLRFVLVAWVLAAASSAAHADTLDIAEGRRLFDARQFEAAFAILQPLAEAGEPDAQYLMGKAYENGSGPLLYNAARSLNWYLKAARKGQICARRRLTEILVFQGREFDTPADQTSVDLRHFQNGVSPRTYEVLVNFQRYITQNYLDETKSEYRLGLIAETVWLWAAVMDKIVRYAQDLSSALEKLYRNEQLIAERLANELGSGALWNWIRATTRSWPVQCS